MEKTNEIFLVLLSILLSSMCSAELIELNWFIVIIPALIALVLYSIGLLKKFGVKINLKVDKNSQN